MRLMIAESWWSPVLRGLVAVGIGIIALTMPGITLGVLVLLFGVYALIDGVAALIAAVRSLKARQHWGFLLFEGIVGIVAAVFTAIWPAVTAITLIYVIAAWAIVTGVLEIAAAIQLRRHIAREWLLALAGVISILFGVFVMAAPLAGALAIAWCIGIYALVFGVLLTAFGLRLRTWSKHPGDTPPIALHAH